MIDQKVEHTLGHCLYCFINIFHKLMLYNTCNLFSNCRLDIFLYMAYIPIRRYSTNISDYNNIHNNKNKQIYRKIYTTD